MNPRENAGPRIPLPPRVRKLVAFAVLACGLWYLFREAEPVTPREMDLRVGLGNFHGTADGVSVSLSRGGAIVRVLSTRFGSRIVPPEWRATVSLPPGDYRATVTVSEHDRALSRESDVRLAPGAPVTIPAPQPE